MLFDFHILQVTNMDYWVGCNLQPWMDTTKVDEKNGGGGGGGAILILHNGTKTGTHLCLI